MSYNFKLEEGDKVIIKVNGKWINGEVKESSTHIYRNGVRENYISVQADRYRMVLFIGDNQFETEPSLRYIVIKRIPKFKNKHVEIY